MGRRRFGCLLGLWESWCWCCRRRQRCGLLLLFARNTRRLCVASSGLGRRSIPFPLPLLGIASSSSPAVGLSTVCQRYPDPRICTCCCCSSPSASTRRYSYQLLKPLPPPHPTHSSTAAPSSPLDRIPTPTPPHSHLSSGDPNDACQAYETGNPLSCPSPTRSHLPLHPPHHHQSEHCCCCCCGRRMCMQAESGSPSRCGCALAAVVVLRGLLAAVRCFADDACSVGPGGASLHNNMKLALFLALSLSVFPLFSSAKVRASQLFAPNANAFCDVMRCNTRCVDLVLWVLVWVPSAADEVSASERLLLVVA